MYISPCVVWLPDEIMISLKFSAFPLTMSYCDLLGEMTAPCPKGTEGSLITIENVSPIWMDLFWSEKTLISKVSLPSGVRSFAITLENLNSPFKSIVPEPLRLPETKSKALMVLVQLLTFEMDQ